MLITEIKSILREDEEIKSGMTLYDYIVNVCDGEIDMDVSDKDIDMTVAFCHDVNSKDNEYPEMTRFLNLIAKRTKIVKQVEGPYEPTLVCDFSSALKPYNEEWKEFFDMDYSEFDEDEAYYEAVVNLEPLISGNAGESTYKEFCDIMEGKKDANKKDINEGKEEADDAYYKVNEVTLKLQEVKPLIKEGTEADKLYTDIMLKLNELQMSLHNEKLNESATEEYWDATEIARDGFMSLLRFNFGYDSKGNNYIVTLDNNEICRFVGGSDEYAKQEFEKIKDEEKAGLINHDFDNSYDKIVEDDFVVDKDTTEPVDLKKQGMCPYCANKLTSNDEWYINKYGMCQECFENGVE